MKITEVNYLIFLLVFLGLGAIGGGGTLIISPSGELIGLPLSLLKHSPFNSFLIPGIILFTVLGVAPCLLAVAVLKRPESQFAELLNCFSDMHWSWTYSVYVAFILILWIQLEMVFLQVISWLHTFYIILALTILLVLLMPTIRNRFKKQVI